MKLSKRFKRIRHTNCGRITEYMSYTNRDRLMLGHESLTYAECKYQLNYVFSKKGKFQSDEHIVNAYAYLHIPRSQRRFHKSLRKIYLLTKQLIDLKFENAEFEKYKKG